jgi:DeoR/GlpR family transcriptional regulator of sugar metabolism
MLTAHRKQLLLDRLRRDGRIVAKDLSAELELSEDTIRRDLRELAADGLLQRVHGGALPASPTVANLAARRDMATEEKRRLGRRAATLLSRGQRIFIDGGTTNLELVRNLPVELPITVVTHSPTIAAALEPHHAIEVILIGGRLFRHSMVATGAAAIEAIGRVQIDLCFIGLTGLHREEGGTTGDFDEAAIKRAVMARSAETVTLLTSEKIGAVSAYGVCASADLTAVVVSGEAVLEGFAGAPFEMLHA